MKRRIGLRAGKGPGISRAPLMEPYSKDVCTVHFIVFLLTGFHWDAVVILVDRGWGNKTVCIS